jgi:hypothetical protein
LGGQRTLEKCKRNTNRKRLKKLNSVNDKMPTFRKLPKVQQGFSEPKQLDGFDVKANWQQSLTQPVVIHPNVRM